MSAGTLRTAGKPFALWSLFFAALVALHISVLDLPYFWDELGQFIPAALDIYQHGWWIPRSTLPNVHPPGVMAYLASIWQVTGYSIVVTRLAMLGLAAAGVLGTYRLAGVVGVSAGYPVLLLILSPLFWAQSIMAQLDMPAMVFTVWAIVLFLRGRHGLCAAVCTVLVLVKESSLVVPAVFGASLLWQRRWPAAMLYFAPALAVAGWLTALKLTTGHWLGNQEFTHYNLSFPIHPVRLPLTLFRRAYYLFVENFHWIGFLVVIAVWRKQPLFAHPHWRTVGLVFALQTLGVTVLGGAALERYLVPVLPLFYLGVTNALARTAPRPRIVLAATFAIALACSNLLLSPFPFPFENNVGFVHFVRLQQRAAEYVEERFPQSTVASAWPFPDALRRPEFGFVSRPIDRIGLHNFDPDVVVRGLQNADVLVLYSRTWEPSWGILRSPWIQRLLSDYYFYKPQITAAQLGQLGFERTQRWERSHQWIEVYRRNTPLH